MRYFARILVQFGQVIQMTGWWSFAAAADGGGGGLGVVVVPILARYGRRSLRFLIGSRRQDVGCRLSCRRRRATYDNRRNVCDEK